MATVDYIGMLKFCFPRLFQTPALSPGGTGQPLEDETTTPGKYLRSCTAERAGCGHPRKPILGMDQYLLIPFLVG